MNINEIENKIRYYSDKYYNDQAEISDAEFDELVNKLRKLDPQNSFFKSVGSKINKKEKIKHRNKMGSLEKIFDTSWLIGRKNVVEMPKLDGLSIEVVYENGVAIQASSRGDGEYGENLLEHVQKMGYGEISQLSNKFSGTLYGEMFMTFSVFEEKYANEYANPRNLVAGISHRLDAEGAEDCKILFFGGDYDECGSNNLLCPYYKIDEKHNPSPRKLWEDYPTDGLVWWDRDTDERVAYKFPAEKKEVIVKDIKWQLSRVGHLVPVLEFDTINLAGANVTRCTCNNASWIVDKKIGIGSKIIVQRANEVIPNLVEVLTQIETELPKSCPVCGSKLERNGAHLDCMNNECENKKFNDIYVFFTKLGIKEFGNAWYQRLFDEGFTNYKKVLDMKLKDYINIGITEYSAKKFMNKVNDAWKSCSPIQFLVGLNIKGASESTFESIYTHFKMNKDNFINDMKKLTVEDLRQVERINKIAPEIVKAIKEKIIYVNDNLCKNYEEVEIDNKLEGKSFCFTGALETMKRSEAEEKVKQKGGKILGVNKNLTYLVTNDTSSGSSKNKKAHELGVKIISEKEFLKMIEK